MRIGVAAVCAMNIMFIHGALYAGVVPVAVNTLLTADDYAFMLAHSRAQAALVSAPLWRRTTCRRVGWRRP